MRGLIFQGQSEAVWKDDLPDPVLEPNDALIRPVIISPCTTDKHVVDYMLIPHMLGKVLGHEMAGVIEAVGDGVKDFKPGDRVIMASCSPDWSNLRVQEGFIKEGDKNPYTNPVTDLQGSFADKVRAADADMNLARIPDNVTWEQAVAITDMATTGFEAVLQAGVGLGDSVAVIGIGAVGLMSVACARLIGAGRIFGVGSREICANVAREYGATDIINYKEGDIVEQILAANGGPVDGVVICGGTTEAAVQGLTMVKHGGMVVNAATFIDSMNISIPQAAFVIDKKFTTILVHGGRLFLDKILTLVSLGLFDPSKIVTHTYHGWDYLEKAFAQMDGGDRECIKPVIFLE